MKSFENRPEVFQKILDTLPNSIYIKDLNGRYIWLNKASQDSLRERHLITASIIGKTDLDVFPDSGAEEYVKNDRVVIETQKGVCIEEEILIPGGQKLIQLSFKEPLYDQNSKELIGVLGYTTDITDRKKKEQLEVEKVALEKSKEMMRFWAASIAHELRTPLCTLDNLSFSVSALGEALNKNPKILVDYPELERPLKGLEVFNRIFPQVIREAQNYIDMTLAKVSPEKVKVRALAPIKIQSVIDNFMERYPFRDSGGGDKEKNLVHLNIQDNFAFNGDEDLIYHVLANLTKNALFYLKKARKGVIYIEALESFEESFNILIFKDTGSGMPPEVAKNLFQAFFSQTSHGTGVGLFLCRTIMTELGGSIECESTAGEFAKFILRFPKIKNL